VNRRPTDLVALIRRAVADFEKLHGGVRVEAVLPPEATVIGDGELIRQVLEELTNNAARAMPQGGRLWARARKIKSEDDVPAIRVEVEDDGPGIAREIREQLFQPYVTTHPEGKGLGLVFVKYVVEQHQGNVWWEDVSPRGVRFVFRLPLAREGADG
jgi:two-component system sensor kinase FixL